MNTRPAPNRASGLELLALLAAMMLAAASITGITGCLGNLARQHVLAPAIKAGAVNAVSLANQSPTVNATAVQQFQAALDANDNASIKATWPIVYSAALDTIDRRTDVSDGVKESLREPLKQTDAAIG